MLQVVEATEEDDDEQDESVPPSHGSGVSLESISSTPSPSAPVIPLLEPVVEVPLYSVTVHVRYLLTSHHMYM